MLATIAADTDGAILAIAAEDCCAAAGYGSGPHSAPGHPPRRSSDRVTGAAADDADRQLNRSRRAASTKNTAAKPSSTTAWTSTVSTVPSPVMTRR